MWWIIIVIIICVVIYKMNNNYNNHVDNNITKHGGMENKYRYIVDYLKSGGAQLKKVTRDSIHLGTNSMNWTLDIVGDDLEVRMKGFVPVLGNINKKWVFSGNYPQAKMVEEIENYLNWQMENFKKSVDNNSYPNF